MLGPIRAIEVASTSMNASDPAVAQLSARSGSAIERCSAGRTAEFPQEPETSPRPARGRSGHEISHGPDRVNPRCLRARSRWPPRAAGRGGDFVQDQAGMFSAATVAQLNERIASFNAQTGKEIVVVTAPSLGGATLQSAAANAFSQQSVNGVLIFIARDDRRDIIVPDRCRRRKPAGSLPTCCARSARRWRRSFAARTTTPESPARSTPSSTSTARTSAISTGAIRRGWCCGAGQHRTYA